MDLKKLKNSSQREIETFDPAGTIELSESSQHHFEPHQAKDERKLLQKRKNSLKSTRSDGIVQKSAKMNQLTKRFQLNKFEQAHA